MDRVTVLWWIESGLTSLKIINDLHDIKMFAVISNMFYFFKTTGKKWQIEWQGREWLFHAMLAF